jgi:hypothetical protein
MTRGDLEVLAFKALCDKGRDSLATKADMALTKEEREKKILDYLCSHIPS